MTEQPVETEQEFLGNAPRGIASRFADALGDSTATLAAPAPQQAYLPNGHRLTGSFSIGKGRYIRPDLAAVAETADLAADLPADEATFALAEPDLWFQAEKQTERGLVEIQNGNVNAGIAFLQSALAFAQNYRHSLTEEVAR